MRYGYSRESSGEWDDLFMAALQLSLDFLPAAGRRSAAHIAPSRAFDKSGMRRTRICRCRFRFHGVQGLVVNALIGRRVDSVWNLTALFRRPGFEIHCAHGGIGAGGHHQHKRRRYTGRE